MAVIAALYWLNRLALLPRTGGVLHTLLASYAADVLAGALMLCALNALLALTSRRPWEGLLPTSLFLLLCGLFWEVVTPMYLPSSVSDPWDVAAVLAGGLSMRAILRRAERRPRRNA